MCCYAYRRVCELAGEKKAKARVFVSQCLLTMSSEPSRVGHALRGKHESIIATV